MEELELIEWVRRRAGDPGRAWPVGIGDDAAVLRPRAGHEIVVTNDALVEGVHFRLSTSSPEDVGHKALHVNLSDVAAMGAVPLGFVLSLGLPERFPTDRLQALLGGVLRAAKRAQRRREKQAGLGTVELRLPTEQAERLRAAMKTPGFDPAFDRFLEQLVVDVDRWPGLRELTWNRADRWIPSEEALSIYERNWRFVDPGELSRDELDLIDRLKRQFGGGVLNA